jgi:hypothetical protein
LQGCRSVTVGLSGTDWDPIVGIRVGMDDARMATACGTFELGVAHHSGRRVVYYPRVAVADSVAVDRQRDAQTRREMG